MLVHFQATSPSIKFASTHLYDLRIERQTVKVKCLAQEHDTLSPARAQTRAVRLRDERINMEPPRLPSKQHELMRVKNYLSTCKQDDTAGSKRWDLFNYLLQMHSHYDGTARFPFEELTQIEKLCCLINGGDWTRVTVSVRDCVRYDFLCHAIKIGPIRIHFFRALLPPAYVLYNRTENSRNLFIC